MMRVTFWFEFASTYSHLSAQRIEAEAEARGVEVEWRPFLLGPIFQAQGWSSSPFKLYPAKGANMWRDFARQAAKLGLPPIRTEGAFPQNSLPAARTALALEPAQVPVFARALYLAQFAEAKDIARPETLVQALEAAGADASALERAQAPEIKAALRANTEEAQRLGLYGAPSFVTRDGELFWGNDRLEDALDWAAGRGADVP